MKENDWLIAGLNNPNYSPGDFKSIGMTLDNTQMLSKDQYLKSDFIKNNDAFKDNTGNFSQLKFDNFYNLRLLDYKNFQDIGSLYKTYDLFDFDRFISKSPVKIKNTGFGMFQRANPDEITIGKGWINKKIDSPFSSSELALKSKVFDFGENKEKDYSVNDHTLFKKPLEWIKDIFKDPLVVATYEEDGIHYDPFTGEAIQHKKGDKKINKEGKYFYETLEGRSIADKEILSGWDTLTVDGSALNKIDFFDSDDKEKSIGGTLIKSAAAITPLLIGGPIGTAYGVALVSKELMKSLPMLDGILAAIPNSDTPFTKLANTIAAKGFGMSQSTSEYSKQHQVSIENFANLMTDVALLWSQQKAVANAIQKLGKVKQIEKDAELAAHSMYNRMAPEFEASEMALVNQLRAEGKIQQAEQALTTALKNIAQAIGDAANWKESQLGKACLLQSMQGVTDKIAKINRIAADASLGYMVAVSNTDLYADLLDQGLSKREALSVVLGSMAGMWKVDKTGLGEAFFDELTSDGQRAIRATLKKKAKDWVENGLEYQANTQGIKGLIQKGKQFGENLFGDLWEDIRTHSGGFLVKATSEGLEEVGEELASDISKLLYEWAAELLPKGVLTKTDIGAFDNISDDPEGMAKLLSRYGMSFFGGFAGGGLFFGVDAVKNGIKKRDKSKDELIYIVRNEGKDKALSVLNEYHKKGKLGSTTISYKSEKDSEGNNIFLSASDENISQNDFVYNQLKNEIETIDAIINDDNLAMSDDELYNQLTMGEIRFLALEKLLKDDNFDYQLGYTRDYREYLNQYVQNEEIIRALQSQIPDQQNQKAIDQIQKKIDIINNEQKELKEVLEKYKSGEFAVDYMGKALFLMDKRVSEQFHNATFETWLKNKVDEDGISLGLTTDQFELLPPTEKQALIDEYLAFKSAQLPLSANEAWKQFKEMREILQPEYEQAAANISGYQQWLKDLNELFDLDLNPLNNVKEYKISDIKVVDTLSGTDETEITYDDITDEEQAQINAGSTALYDSRLQQAGEADDVFEARKNTRLQRLAGEKIAKLNHQEKINALQKIELIIANSGGMLDSLTKRHLQMQLGIREKDIIQHEAMKSRELRTDSVSRYVAQKIAELENIDPTNIDNIKIDAENEIIQLIKLTLEKYVKYYNAIADFCEGCGIRGVPSLANLEQAFNEENNNRATLLGMLNDYIDSGGQFDKSIINDKLTAIGESSINLDNEYEVKNALITLGFNNLQASFISSKNSEDVIESLQPIYLTENSIQRDDFIRSKVSFDEYADTLIELLTEAVENIIASTGVAPEILVGQYIHEHALEYNGIAISAVTNFDPMDNEYNLINIDSLIANGPILGATSESDKNKNKLIRYISSQQSNINNKISQVVRNIQNDDIYRYIQNIKNTAVAYNPITDFIKKIGVYIGKDTTNVEDLLNRMSSLMDEKGGLEFTLNASDKRLLDEAEELLKLTKSFIYASFDSKTTSNPYPHNQLMNLMSSSSNLPVIDAETGVLFILQIDSLLGEIGQPQEDERNPYTIGSLRWFSQKNEFNKIQSFIKTDKRFTQTKLDLFETYKDKLTIHFGGNNINLLEGIESLPQVDSDSRLHLIEDLFFKNVLKFLQDNPSTSFKDVLENCQAFLEITHLKDTELQELLSTQLDEYVNINTLTAQDKILYFATIASISSSEFNKFLKDTLSDKVPFSAQEHVSRIGMAVINNYKQNTKIVEEALDFLYTQANFTINKGPYLSKAIFIEGNGGAGKTDIVARNLLKFINDDEHVALLGPTSTQVDTLKGISPNAKLNTVEVFIKNLIGEINYNQIIAEGNGAIGTWTTKVKPSYSNSDLYTPVLNDLTILPDTNDLKAIIIDESTHITTLQLSILNEYSKKYNIPLILLGDTFQNGINTEIKNSRNSILFPTNVNKETFFCARSPRLNITFRDAAIQKALNIDQFVQVLQHTENIPNGIADRNIRIKSAIESASKITLNYYQGQEINGDLITSNLTDDLINKVNFNSIGYLGKDTDLEYTKLKDKYGDKVTLITSETELQGKEFDVMICNPDFNNSTIIDIFNKIKNHQSIDDYDNALNNVSNFIRRIYTLSSRGKTATIYIDSTNTLNQCFDQERLNYLNTSSGLNSQGRLEYFDRKKGLLDSFTIDETLKPNPISTPTIGSAGVSSRASRSSESHVDPYTVKPMDDEIISEDEALTESKFYTELQDCDALAYGDFSLGGVERLNDNSWKGSSEDERNNSKILTDLDIFLEPNQVVSNGIEKSNLVKDLISLKGLILIGGQYYTDNVSSVLTHLGYDSSISFIDIKDSIKYKIEVSPRNTKTDYLIGYTGLSNDGMEINGSETRLPLVYKIVAEIPSKTDQPSIKITLGALSDPMTFTQSIEKLNADLDYKKKRLSRLNAITVKSAKEEREIKRLRSRIAALNNYLKGREAKTIKYQTFLNDLYNNWLKSGQEIYSQEVDEIISSESTEIIGNGLKVRLSDFINESLRTGKYFKRKYPYASMSDVYIVGQDDSTPEELFGKMGHAIIFVSSNPNMQDLQLINQYRRQAQDPSLPKTVRVILLDNLGVSYSQLFDRNVLSEELETTTEDSEEFNKYPMETLYTGARLIVELHNYRARLLKFELSLNSLTIDRNQIDNILIDLQEAYQEFKNETLIDSESEWYKQDHESEFRNWYKTKYPSKYNVAKTIWDFNDSLANSVKQFRLGIGSKYQTIEHGVTITKRRGHIIRKLTNISKDNPFYKNIKTPYGTYLSIEELSKQLSILNNLFDALNNEFKLLDSSGYLYNPEEEIDINDKGNISGKIDDVFHGRARLTIQTNANPNNDNYKLITHIPRILNKIGSRAVAFSKTIIDGKERYLPKTDEDKAKHRFRITTAKGIETDREPWIYRIADNVSFNEHYKEGNENKEVKHSINVKSLVESGEDFAKLMELIFHGTTDKFNNAIDIVDFTPQASDAYFKQGFLVDPIRAFNASSWDVIEGLGKIKRCLTNPALLALSVKFTLPRIGIKVHSTKSTITEKPVKETKELTEIEQLIQTYSNLQLISKKLFENSSEYPIFRKTVINAIATKSEDLSKILADKEDWSDEENPIIHYEVLDNNIFITIIDDLEDKRYNYKLLLKLQDNSLDVFNDVLVEYSDKIPVDDTNDIIKAIDSANLSNNALNYLSKVFNDEAFGLDNYDDDYLENLAVAIEEEILGEEIEDLPELSEEDKDSIFELLEKLNNEKSDEVKTELCKLM